MKVCHYLPGDMGGGGYSEIVTNGDMRGGGPKIVIFAVMSFLNGPYNKVARLETSNFIKKKLQP